MAASSTSGVGRSVVIQKPAINWGELSSPLETTAKKASRHFGQFLVVLGLCSGVCRQLAAARMTASPDTIIRTCATLQVVMLVSLVVGAVLWFFNRLTQDPSLLLQQRREVQTQIEETALAELREKYKSPFVFSDAELNQWIRYLAGSAPFNDFMTKQSDKIFDLPLEDKTRKLLTDLYVLYVQDAAPPFKKFIAEKALQVLLDTQERADFTESVANFAAANEAIRVGVCTAKSYRTFISVQGVSIISHLNLPNLQSLAQGFCADAMESGVGIVNLKNNRREELQAFGPNIETCLFQQVANREGLQSYEIFSTRNGDEAVSYITNPEVKEDLFKRFSNFVVGKKYGLDKTREDFGRTIGMFGEGAADRINTLVLTDEIGALTRGEFTYLNFRQRNGIGAIQLTIFGNENLKQQIKACFLRLPASDLIHPDYAIDRNLFGITLENVQSELLRRWNGMTFAEILRTDREGFVAAVAGPHRCLDPRGWTEKAFQETAELSIIDILSTYGVLFTTGVLTADNGDFKNRLAREITSITEWTALIDTYGAFVFEQGLLVSTQVENLVSNFIRTCAESFLNDSFEGAMSQYVQVIQRYCMNSSMAQKIKDAKVAVATEKQRYAEWLKSHEAEFERKIQARSDAANREIVKFQSDHQITDKESAKKTAHREWSEKKVAYEALNQGMKACQKEIAGNQETLSQKYTALRELRTRQASISVDVHLLCAKAETALQQAQRNVLLAVALVQKHPLQPQLESLQKEERELQSTLQKIEDRQQEHTTLSEEVNKPAFATRKKELEKKIVHPDQPVTGLKAAELAKKEATEAPKLLAAMKVQEEKLDEATRWLSQTNAQPIKTRFSKIRSEKAKIESTLAQVEAQAQLPQLRAEESRALGAVSQWKTLKGESLSLSQQIFSFSEEIEQLRRQIDQKTGALKEKTDRCEESRRQFLAAEAKKQTTEIAYNISVEKLAQVTTEIRQECTAHIERMGREKTQVLLQAQSTNTQALQGIVFNFRSSI